MNIDKIITYNYNQFGNEFGDTLVDLKNENERLNNIINELEKYLIEYSQDLEFRCYANTFLDKLRKLKGDDSNE